MPLRAACHCGQRARGARAGKRTARASAAAMAVLASCSFAFTFASASATADFCASASSCWEVESAFLRVSSVSLSLALSC